MEFMHDPERGVNWDDDWKLITILIGANDLCQYCDDEVGIYDISAVYLNTTVKQITHASFYLSPCLSLSLSPCMITKHDRCSNMEFDYVVVLKNSSDDFDIGH